MKLLKLFQRSILWSQTRKHYYFALPYKGLDYLADHFDYIDRIHRFGYRCSQWRQIVFCILVLLYKALCYAIQSQIDYDEEEKVLFMHVYGVLGMPKECDLVTIVFCLQVAHFLYVLYFRNVNQATWVMKSILIDQQDDFFMYKHAVHEKQQNKNISFCQLVTRQALRLMNLLQAHTVIISKSIIESTNTTQLTNPTHIPQCHSSFSASFTLHSI